MVRDTMFPPPLSTESSDREQWVASQLRHCVRCLPTDFNSGGFFLAQFERRPRAGAAQPRESTARNAPSRGA